MNHQRLEGRMQAAFWWLLAVIALLFTPAIHVAFNLTGNRTTYMWLYLQWREQVRSRGKWGPIA